MKLRQYLIPLCITMMSMVGMTNCNADKEDDPDYRVSSNLAVSNFYLKNSSGSTSGGVDSVFFSIDLERRLIFNADSLPKGADIRKLVPVITVQGAVSSLKITMSGGEHRTGTVDYIKNPTDTIDFTGDVILSLVAQDGVSACDYKVKVNVHKMEPDSLWWDEMAVAELPSRLPMPKSQRTIKHGDMVYSMIEESDGSYTLSSTDSPASGMWNKQQLELTYKPDIRSFNSTSESFYMLDNEGNLYKSGDAVEWSLTGCQWMGIIGGYDASLIGLKEESGQIVYASYPDKENCSGKVVDADFPIKGYSSFSSISNEWIVTPIGLLTGGVKQSGELSGATWGYDGENWAKLSAHEAPAVDGGTMISYYQNKSNTEIATQSEQYHIWMFVGGRLADGSFNRDMYISYDNGVNWFKGGELIQLPEYIPGMMNVDNVIITTMMTGNFEPQSWASMASKDLPNYYRLSCEVEGYNVSWECPYIFLFGGVGADGVLCNTIWKGVVNRLTFMPLI